MTDKSLYERLGGTYGIAAAVDVLVEKLFKNEKFVNSELIASNCLSIPIDPNLSLNDQKKICATLNKY